MRAETKINLFNFCYAEPHPILFKDSIKFRLSNFSGDVYPLPIISNLFQARQYFPASGYVKDCQGAECS